MIPAPSGWEGLYESSHVEPSGTKRVSTDVMPVVAWDDNGDALDVDSTTGRLVVACHAGKLTEVTRTGTTHVLPGGGWLAEYREDGGALVSYPIVAWQASAATGYLAPVTVEDAGFPETDINSTGNFVRVWHPTWPQPDPAASGS